MPRRFNTAGPCVPGVHYMLPPERRLSEARGMIEEGLFFVLHAPRQTGKTTLLNGLARALNEEGRFTALVISVEFLRHAKGVSDANLAIAGFLFEESERFLPEAERAPAPSSSNPAFAVHHLLAAWAAASPKPIVLLLDEVDSLPDDILLNLLGQLRMGYTARPAPFVHSLALVGLRDVRDYRVQLRPESQSLGTSSPFNVKSESLTLRNFTRDEVAELYAQHTEETGQVFEEGAVTHAFQQTAGQPWLVSALARQITEKAVTDRARPITAADVETAKEVLIERRDTHIDSLVDKLHEARVRRIIQPILTGALLEPDVLNDDLVYVRDLGLVTTDPAIQIANPIYQEIIPRALTYVIQRTIVEEASSYTRPDGSLDMSALLRSFQSFFAEHSESWLGRFDYHEAGPHLVLMAFLQRVVNGGGSVQRELAVGSGRVDIHVKWHGQRFAVELKIRRGERTEAQGVEQLARYLDRLRLPEGYLVIFDRRPDRSWDEKLFEKEVTSPNGKLVRVFGA